MVKKGLFLLALISVVIIISVFGLFWHSISFASKVDTSSREEIGKLLVQESVLSNDIYQLDFRNGQSKSPLEVWSGKLAKIVIRDTNSEDEEYIDGVRTYIETSVDNGKTWLPLTYIKKSSCSYYFTYLDRLYCFTDLSSVSVITEDGVVTNHALFLDTDSTITSLIAIIRKSSNVIVYIWSDDRSRSTNPIAYILSSLFSVPIRYKWGPNIIVAGELNLDTMQTKEHIIQYGPDSGRFIYDGKEWGSLMINNDGISEYPKIIE